MKLPESVSAHLVALGVTSCLLQPVFGAWLSEMFVGHVPFLTALRIMDLCLVLGSKALYRVAVAITLSAASDIQRASNAEEVVFILRAKAASYVDYCRLTMQSYAELGSLPQRTMISSRRWHQRRHICDGDMSRFYGARVQPLKHLNKPGALAVRHLCLAAQGTQVWGLSSDGTIQIWDRSFNSKISVVCDHETNSICALHSGEIWVGGPHGHISRFSAFGTALPSHIMPSAEKQAVTKTAVDDVLLVSPWCTGVATVTRNGAISVWEMSTTFSDKAASQSGFVNRNGAVKTLKLLGHVRSPTTPSCLCNDVQGRLWLGTVDCVLRYDWARKRLDNHQSVAEWDVQHHLAIEGQVQAILPVHANGGNIEIWAGCDTGCLTVIDSAGSSFVICSGSKGVTALVSSENEVWSGHIDGTGHHFTHMSCFLLSDLPLLQS